MNPEEMVSRLLYRDGLMLVIDKPAGFAVHRGPKSGERGANASKTISAHCGLDCRARRL
jgi:23S rRNA-/tRNA-specific pseudouridylate synthase